MFYLFFVLFFSNLKSASPSVSFDKVMPFSPFCPFFLELHDSTLFFLFENAVNHFFSIESATNVLKLGRSRRLCDPDRNPP